MIKINKLEFAKMKEYIEKHCGIHLPEGKEYLVETRLSTLLRENECVNFSDFYNKIQLDKDAKLKDRIVDAMTTNETSWFRDQYLWDYIREVAVPELVEQVVKQGSVRIWSAAASTGQEAYSLLMTFDEALKAKGAPSLIEKISILGTDISSSALFAAISARYDQMSINRGLPEDKKKKYFTCDENVWVFDQVLKKRVEFKEFNLINDFTLLGTFDMVMCRNVAIYFSPAFKKKLFSKIAKVLKPKGVLILGATETLKDLAPEFEVTKYKNAVINVKK